MNNRIAELEKLKKKDKFSNEEWENRGLNSSPKNLSDKLEKTLNDLITDLISASNSEKSEQETGAIFQHYFKKIDSDELDTEEKEFVIDYLDTIAAISNTKSVTKNLNIWISGTETYDHENAERLASEKALADERKRYEMISIACSKCKILLNTYILERDIEIPGFEYDVIKCVKCHELNLLDKGAGIKRFRFINYELIEELPKQQYDLDNALSRLAQLKLVLSESKNK